MLLVVMDARWSGTFQPAWDPFTLSQGIAASEISTPKHTARQLGSPLLVGLPPTRPSPIPHPPPLPLPPQSLIPGKDVKATQFEANFGFFKKRISVGFTKGNGEWLQGHPPPLAPPLAPARRVLPRPLLGTWCQLGCKLAGSPLPASMD